MKKLLTRMGGAAALIGLTFIAQHVIAQSVYGDVVALNESPLRITSVPSAEIITSADTVDVVYTFENPADGPGDISVTIEKFIPDWGSLTQEPSSNSTDFVYTESTTSAIFTLAQGASSTVTFTYRVNEDASLTEMLLPYELLARYQYQDSSDPLEYTTILRYASSLALVGDDLDLALTAGVSPSNPTQGERVTFTYVVTNNETVALPSQAAILAQLPPVFRFVSYEATTSSDFTTTQYDESEGVLSIHNLLPGGVVTLTVFADFAGSDAEEDIVQDAYLTHAYVFSSNRDGVGNFMGTPAAVDFAIVDSAQVIIVAATENAVPATQGNPETLSALPYTALGAVTPDVFDAGTTLELSYTFDANDVTSTETWNASQGVFSAEIPAGMTPTTVNAARIGDESLAFTEQDSSWSFDATTRILTWSMLHSTAITSSQGAFYDISFTISVSTDVSMTDSAFVFPATFTLLAQSTETSVMLAQILSVMPTATRNIVVEIVEPEVIAYEQPTSSGGGSSRRGTSTTTPDVESALSEDLTYAIYIVNADGTIRTSESAYSGYSLIENDRYGILTFDETGEDMTYDDIVVNVDSRDCSASLFSVQKVKASTSYQVGIAVFQDDIQIANYLLFTDASAALGSAQELNLASLLDDGTACGTATARHNDAMHNGGCIQMCETDKTEYYLSIVNPDGTRRETRPPYSEVDRKAYRDFTIRFEDSGSDFDYNDVVMDLNVTDCSNMRATGVSIDAAWHHGVYGTLYYNGKRISDTQLTADSHTFMGQTVTIDANDAFVMCISE